MVPIKASDLTDLRSWLYDSDSDNTSYETSAWAETRRARAFHEYDSTDDSAGAGKGRRTGMWDGSGSSSWKYDKYGRGGVDRRVVDGKTYETEYTYDALHRARKMTYPDDEALTYSYEASLLLDGMQSSTDSLNLVSSVSYEDIGLPDSYTLGGGTNTATQSFEYWKIDDPTRSPYAALKRTKLTKGTTDLVNREMQYDPVGNVTKIVDGVNSETIDYTYDDLDRLLTASVPTGDSYTYNTIGNMTSKSGATLDYGTTSPKHGVKTYGSASYTYDANGSMTAKGDLSIKYDPERRPVRVQDGSTIYRVAYDGDGVRRKRLDENGTIHYLGHYERNVGNGSDTTEVVTKYYYATLGAMMRLIAFRRGGTLHWAGTDHLGGTIRVMDSSFAAVDGMRYEPYGEDRDSGDSLNTDRKFTGQTEDETVGLYWYQSRAYDPEIGRFCSPDPIVPAPGNPQSLNRYSYVYNNPLKYTDPTGHYSVEDDKDWIRKFSQENDGPPTASDEAFRKASMEAALQGQDFSVEYWAGLLERAASNKKRRSTRIWEHPLLNHQQTQEELARLQTSKSTPTIRDAVDHRWAQMYRTPTAAERKDQIFTADVQDVAGFIFGLSGALPIQGIGLIFSLNATRLRFIPEPIPRDDWERQRPPTPGPQPQRPPTLGPQPQQPPTQLPPLQIRPTPEPPQ